jgi:hypothetical protein
MSLFKGFTIRRISAPVSLSKSIRSKRCELVIANYADFLKKGSNSLLVVASFGVFFLILEEQSYGRNGSDLVTRFLKE